MLIKTDEQKTQYIFGNIDVLLQEDIDPMNEQRLKNYVEKGVYGTDEEIRESNATLKMFAIAVAALVIATVLVSLSN